jgi:hypothetical protein
MFEKRIPNGSGDWEDRPVLRLIALLATSAIIAGCSPAPSTEEFTLIQGSPALTSIRVADRPGGANAHGDLMAFEAPVSRDGGVVGDVSGLLTTVDIPASQAAGRDALEERFGTLVFRFNDIDTIVVSGSSVYPPAEAEMTADTPQLRAVLGGTGAYAAAAGEVETVRNADGTYGHRFTLFNVK